MQNKLLSIDAKLEKDRFKGLEIWELNDTENLLNRCLWTKIPKLAIVEETFLGTSHHLLVSYPRQSNRRYKFFPKRVVDILKKWTPPCHVTFKCPLG